MKTAELYFNQHQMVQDLALRKNLSFLIESSSPDELRSLGSIMANKSWGQRELEFNLGSSAIEYLLDCIENADHHQLQNYKQVLEAQGVHL